MMGDEEGKKEHESQKNLKVICFNSISGFLTLSVSACMQLSMSTAAGRIVFTSKRTQHLQFLREQAWRLGFLPNAPNISARELDTTGH